MQIHCQAIIQNNFRIPFTFFSCSPFLALQSIVCLIAHHNQFFFRGYQKNLDYHHQKQTVKQFHKIISDFHRRFFFGSLSLSRAITQNKNRFIYATTLMSAFMQSSCIFLYSYVIGS